MAAFFLALAILGYGTAWAFAPAAADGVGHGVAAGHWTPGDADHADSTCDHGCHAAVHLLALHRSPIAPAG